MLIWILIQGYSGRIEAMGRWREDYFEHVGVCFEQPSNYRKLTALENLTFFAGFFRTRHARRTRSSNGSASRTRRTSASKHSPRVCKSG